MSDTRPTETVDTGRGPDDALTDVVSDPARDARVGSDWTDEGGAQPAGPATASPGTDGDRAAETPAHGTPAPGSAAVPPKPSPPRTQE